MAEALQVYLVCQVGGVMAGWLFLVKNEHFSVDPRFSLNFPKITETVYQARRLFSGESAPVLLPDEIGLEYWN